MPAIRLQEVLVQFLREGKALVYPVLETRILQLNPLRITDDLQSYIDLQCKDLVTLVLHEAVLSLVDDSPGANYKLVLTDWRFVFRKVPNSHEFFFDIESDNFKVSQVPDAPELDELPSKLIDNEEVR
jgi:hypothetical protein